MRQRSLLLLLAATIVATTAAGRSLLQERQAIAPASHDRLAFPGLSQRLGELAWLRLARGRTAIDFAAIGGTWRVVEMGNYPAAQDRVRHLLRGLADLVLLAPKTRRPGLFGRLGLDDPEHGRSRLVSAQDRAGRTVAALILGNTRADPVDGAEVYVRRPGARQTWLARGAFALPTTAIGWLDRRILDIGAARIADVTLTAGDGAVLRLRRASAAAAFAIADAPAGAAVKNAAALAAPAWALSAVDFNDVRPEPDLPVPAGGTATAVFRTFDGLRVTARLFAAGGRDWLALSASGKGAAALDARLRGWVYAIPAARARLLRTRLADLVANAR